jgi:hypothetical protein
LLLLLIIVITATCGGGGGGGGDGGGGGGGGTTPTLSSIAVTPANPSITVGVTQQFTATGTYSDSSTQNITSSVTWGSSSTGVATINAGLATAMAEGLTTITATSGSVSGNTVLTVSTIRLPRTGQTTCYDRTGAPIPCTGSGQDGELQKGVSWPSSRFMLSGACITDDLTGLMWIGSPDSTLRVWTGTGDTFTYVKSLNVCTFTDWRIPNKRELRSLVNYAETNPGVWLIAQGFSNVKNSVNEYYWSSTSSWAADNAFRLMFYDGNELGNTKTQHYTWAVRTASVTSSSPSRTGQITCYNYSGVIIPCAGTGQDGELQTGVVWPSQRFTNPDGTTPITGETVIDRLTGLIWTKDANKPGPTACFPGTTGDSQGALNYIACLNTNQYLGYSDWRLPNINELESLATADTQDTVGYLTAQGFVNVQTAMPYWSSTTAAGRTDYAWVIPFFSTANGNVVTSSKTNSYSIWPMRGGQ